MSVPILATKLYISPPPPKAVSRPRLLERLNEGLSAGRKLTLISASAGFGKTTLVSEWIASRGRPVAWLSLDEGDNDPTRFLIYLVTALQKIATNIGAGILGALQSPQPPPIESILTALINQITTIPDNFIFFLDDYHIIDSKPVDNAITFLLTHMPPQMHLVIATREDPHLPLARLRARGQLTELRAADLRFTLSETVEFLKQAMGLNLLPEDIVSLEDRTEGWIAGLQLAALSMQGRSDLPSFIKSFSGSHLFVLDYLVEEVLQHQSESVQMFLLHTSILDRLCGPLCDAIQHDPFASGQETLEYLERANLFIVPLDNERRWYRYHHLFVDLLRQRLHQSVVSSAGDEGTGMAELHMRASVWYENNGLEIEAFHHAAEANDVERAERLVEGRGMPLHFRGALAPVMNWLESLPTTILDATPSLWVTYASVLSMIGRPIIDVEEKLHAAEEALQGIGPDNRTQNLVGQIAAIRAMLAIPQNQIETMITQSRRALDYLHPDNLSFRATAMWTLGLAHQFQGDRTASSQAYVEAIKISRASGNFMVTIAATTCLGQVQEAENQLNLAAETYRSVVQLAGNPPLPFACEAHLGLARILYQWNDLDAAEQHGQQSAQLAQQLATVDTPVVCGVFLARLKLALGDVAGAVAILAKADQYMRQHNFLHRMPEVAAMQVLTLLQKGKLSAAVQLAVKHELPISQARVYLAQGDTSKALEVLEPIRQQIEAKGWADERLKVMVLQTVALHAHGEKEKAMQVLDDALMLAEPGGFIRTFVDEGLPMSQLLFEAAARGMMPDYTDKLLASIKAEQKSEDKSTPIIAKALIGSLSQRELEILKLIALGLSNRAIGERLFLAVDTVKGHNRRIFDKLQVQNRTEAVARAHELGLM